ncbi:uncharacterized protein LOC106067604 [Biomphalaria glabrata]|uniref:Uncharacterized protein LOC106067604 n=1 Tax=Biomphalaria glabrata TaxID=6526 RepID=A0A9W2YR55_BIOGL|nr:uncharacterized protein LOC106067604 [Biomphalaria glabrata]
MRLFLTAADCVSILFVSFILLCHAGPPTLDAITNKICPPDKPYKCLPYGKCYGVESYCDSKSGTVKSCFPPDMSEKEIWCREFGHNVTFMRDQTCLTACSLIFLQDSYNLLNNVCSDSSPHKCPPAGECYNSLQYCQSGKVHSCFPEDAKTNLLDWCKTKGLQNVTFMNHNSCQLACQTLFSIADLAPDKETINIGLLITLIIVIAILVIVPFIIWRSIILKKLQSVYNRNRPHGRGKNYPKRKIVVNSEPKHSGSSFLSVPLDPVSEDVKLDKEISLKKLQHSTGSSVLLRQNSKPTETSFTNI